MDNRNTLKYHLIVVIGAIGITLLFNSTGVGLNRAVAGTAFLLLFLCLAIGPAMRLWWPSMKWLPWELPWSWRGELGIWFVVWSFFHLIIFLNEKNWDLGTWLTSMRLGEFIGLVALALGLILAVTSGGKIIKYLGTGSWKWLHSMAYAVFYLVVAHTVNHSFLRTGRPDNWMHWMYLVLMIGLLLLQGTAFLKTVKDYRLSQKKLANQNK